ncbi:MAG: hypothetical protein KAS63_06560 [Candidatus Heimdallarchaeota archaeon]|nr:hypothetical protein [Candidatus Heimdallarchaeota archaeon]MCK4955005.1 hypothetical protein [Candidatus Heimdallarchaeota archaeon]
MANGDGLFNLGSIITMLLPILIFVGLYLAFYIWGRVANRRKKEAYFDDVLTAIDPYITNYSRKDPNDRQVEIRCQLDEEFIVTSASAWLILLPRTSFPTMLVDGLFFRNKDSFGLAANFSVKPRVLFEVIPYKMKSAIRKDFDYLVEIDDVSTPDDEVNENFLIKSNRARTINQLIRSNMFLKSMKHYPKEIQWISIRTDEPHFEMKFSMTNQPADLLALTKFSFTVMKFFATVTEKTKDLPIPVILKKEPKKLSEKELAKKEKEKEKYLREREKRREKDRKEEEKRAKKRARQEEKAMRRGN